MSENREYITRAEEQGDIYISEDVLAMIAGAAALEIDGVTGLPGSNLGEQLLGKRNYTRGIVITRDEDSLVVNMSITIQYGSAIPELARKVQEAVISALEATGGLTVRAVNIRVGGVTFEKSAK